MRRPSAYYLLLLYCTVLMRCAIPVACDGLSHIFNEEDHIATVHAMYGSDHLEKEIASEEKDSNKNQTSVKNEDQVAVHLSIEAFNFIPRTIVDNNTFSGFPFVKPAIIFLSKEIQPPRFSLVK